MHANTKLAPNWSIEQWLDKDGKTMENPISLSDYDHRFLVIFAFQSWCPGCHSHGFPSLKTLIDAFKDDDRIAFLAIQTVFEGYEANTLETTRETQKKYNLNIPFGYDPGIAQLHGRPSIMENYETRGTPWFIFIDQHRQVVFSDFHLDADKAVQAITNLLDSHHH